MKCEQCGMFHPPLAQGQSCPMAKGTSATGESIDFNLLFGPLKNICTAQIEIKKIKDWRKMFAEITLKINEYVENYTE